MTKQAVKKTSANADAINEAAYLAARARAKQRGAAETEHWILGELEGTRAYTWSPELRKLFAALDSRHSSPAVTEPFARRLLAKLAAAGETDKDRLEQALFGGLKFEFGGNIPDKAKLLDMHPGLQDALHALHEERENAGQIDPDFSRPLPTPFKPGIDRVVPLPIPPMQPRIVPYGPGAPDLVSRGPFPPLRLTSLPFELLATPRGGDEAAARDTSPATSDGHEVAAVRSDISTLGKTSDLKDPGTPLLSGTGTVNTQTWQYGDTSKPFKISEQPWQRYQQNATQQKRALDATAKQLQTTVTAFTTTWKEFQRLNSVLARGEAVDMAAYTRLLRELRTALPQYQANVQAYEQQVKAYNDYLKRPYRLIGERITATPERQAEIDQVLNNEYGLGRDMRMAAYQRASLYGPKWAKMSPEDRKKRLALIGEVYDAQQGNIEAQRVLDQVGIGMSALEGVAKGLSFNLYQPKWGGTDPLVQSAFTAAASLPMSALLGQASSLLGAGVAGVKGAQATALGRAGVAVGNQLPALRGLAQRMLLTELAVGMAPAGQRLAGTIALNAGKAFPVGAYYSTTEALLNGERDPADVLREGLKGGLTASALSVPFSVAVWSAPTAQRALALGKLGLKPTATPQEIRRAAEDFIERRQTVKTLAGGVRVLDPKRLPAALDELAAILRTLRPPQTVPLQHTLPAIWGTPAGATGSAGVSPVPVSPAAPAPSPAANAAPANAFPALRIPNDMSMRSLPAEPAPLTAFPPLTPVEQVLAECGISTSLLPPEGMPNGRGSTLTPYEDGLPVQRGTDLLDNFTLPEGEAAFFPDVLDDLMPGFPKDTNRPSLPTSMGRSWTVLFAEKKANGLLRGGFPYYTGAARRFKNTHLPEGYAGQGAWYQGMDLEVANEVNGILLDITRECDRLKLPRLRGVIAMNDPELPVMFMGDGYLHINTAEVTRRDLAVPLPGRYDIGDLRQQVYLSSDLAQTRLDEFRTRLWHEYGHHIHQQYQVVTREDLLNPPLEKRLFELYNEGVRSPTMYAGNHPHLEMFAEACAVLRLGGEQRIHPRLLALLREVGL